MSKYRKYKQGVFRPTNKSKCKSGSYVYRSSWELTYMRWLDTNSNVISWGSEEVCVPYIKPTDGKMHRYFVDFNFTIKDKDGKLHKFLVEVKPNKQCKPPNTKNRKNKMNLLREQMTYAINTSKWTSAKSWAKKNNYKFVIITEKDLKKLKE